MVPYLNVLSPPLPRSGVEVGGGGGGLCCDLWLKGALAQNLLFEQPVWL